MRTTALRLHPHRFAPAVTGPGAAWSRIAAVVLAVLTVVATLFVASPASADEGDLVVIGRGWGHGRGMGQYGAYGYAQQGWDSERILDHFYGGTTAGPIPTGAGVDPDRVRVDLRFMRGRPTTVGLGSGTIVVHSPAGAELARVGDGAVMLVATGSGFEVRRAPGCDGPWITMGLIEGTTAHLRAETGASGTDGLLHACGSSYRVWYEGQLVATRDGGSARTVNLVTIEQYLRGVVPNEMPALWPEAALEAQAVAARSYAMAGDTRQQPWADTCDTILCQVYDGAYTERGGSLRSAHHPRTDAAIAATAGLVRLRANGSVARTEFSSSTGGYTAGGDFPAVADAGDGIAANPNHTWVQVVPRAAVERHYGLGELVAADVVTRNGFGADGGRAVTVRFDFERGTVLDTGDRVRRAFGLKSNWYTLGSGSGAELLGTPDGAYVNRAYVELGGRAATNAELVAWHSQVEVGSRHHLTWALATDRHFVGVLLDDLYQSTFDRPADAQGRAYWRNRLDEGMSLQSLTALFFGSDEYYERSGGNDEAYLQSLYRRNPWSDARSAGHGVLAGCAGRRRRDPP